MILDLMSAAGPLESLGYLRRPEVASFAPAEPWTPGQVAAALRAYQAAWELPPTGDLDAATLESLHALRFCPADRLTSDATGPCKWPLSEVNLGIRADATFGAVSLESAKAVARAACAAWSAACGLRLKFVADAAAAHIVIGSGRLDGPMNVLAQSELPCGAVTRVRQTYDASEQWVVGVPPQRNQILLHVVMLHEVGHAIGIDHIAPGNVLAPTYNPALTQLQPGDVAEAVKRYGPPAAAPQPPVPPAPAPAAWAVTGQFNAVCECGRRAKITPAVAPAGIVDRW